MRNVLSVSDTGGSGKKSEYSQQEWTYDFLVTNQDALPMIYRRLVSSKVIKLGSCDKHTANC